jgi:hypothetical protein
VTATRADCPDAGACYDVTVTPKVGDPYPVLTLTGWQPQDGRTLDHQFPDGALLAGVLHDPDGSPVGGTLVRLYMLVLSNPDTPPTGRLAAEALADGSGQFRLVVPTP